MMKYIYTLFMLPFLLMAQPSSDTNNKKNTTASPTGKKVVYHLYVNDTTVNITGKKRKALAINGSIPAPTLYFEVGDTALIYVHNQLKQTTSTHWHGLLLPNEQDGVPYVTTAPIKSGTTHIFTFPIIHEGTYWYHSHTGLQEQSGLYGSIVIRKPNHSKVLREQVVLLSDWTNEKPAEVMRSLKRGTDWYEIKKGSVQSWGEATVKGYFVDKLKQEWRRMLPMDVADVYYPSFLANGKKEDYLTDLKAGDSIKIRLINGSASSYFYINYGGKEMTVVAADGVAVVPVKTKKLLIATAETYDIILYVPTNESYELKATAQDISGSTSVWLGSGKKISAPILPRLQYFEMMRNMGTMKNHSMKSKHKKMIMDSTMHQNHKMDNEMKREDSTHLIPMNDKEHSQHQMSMNMDMSKDTTEWSYDQLRAVEKTVLPANNVIRKVMLDVTGNMNRYVWSFNNKPLSREAKISIKKGENVQFVFNNKTMMSHPLHLHGHFFRLLNGQGEYSPLKHTVNIEPMQVVTIEFEANEEKDWFFHCHLLYHMMSGMARVISYQDTATNTQVPNRKKALRKVKQKDKQWYLMGDLAIHSQAVYGKATLSNIYNAFDAEWRVNWKLDYETELHYSRFLDHKQFLKLVVGADIRLREGGEQNTKDNRKVAHIGLQYTLPFFIEAGLRVDHTGKVRFQLSREDIAITNRLRFNWMVNTDREYMLGLKFIATKNLAVSANYDSDFGWGAGLTFTY